MARGDKSKETFEKVAETFEKKGAKDWAKAKNGEGGFYYESARRNFSTADKARESAKKNS